MKAEALSAAIALLLMVPNAEVSAGTALPYPDSETRTLSLEDCITLASNSNINVKNARLDYMSAKMLKSEAMAHYFPTIGIYAAGYHALDPMVKLGVSDILGTSDMANNIKYYLETAAQMNGIKTYYETLGYAYGAVVNLIQPVYAGGRIVNSNRLASLGIKAASLNESIAKRDAITDIEKKYWLAVSLQQKMKVVESGIELADSLYKDALSAYSSGLLTSAEKTEVEIARQDLKSKRIRLKGGIMLAKMDLCNAIGLDFSDTRKLKLQDSIGFCQNPEIYYKDPSEVVGALEETQLLGMAVEQKQLEKKVAMGDAMPQIGIGAMYGYMQLIGKPQQNGMVYATVKIPLSDWSITGSKMKSINYQLEKAGNQREYLSSMLELQLRQLWVEVESTWEELQLAEDKLDKAQNLLMQSQENHKAGMETKSSMMEKEVALKNAECDRIDAQIAYRNAIAAFQSKCGR